MEQIDKSKFITNERAGEFDAVFRVTGTIRTTIKAADLDEAKTKAEALTEDEEFGQDIDDVEEVRIGHVSKSPTMYLVLRDGRKFQVSRIQDGDTPREPDENGF